MCHGTGRMDVFNLWDMQRTMMEYGHMDIDSFAALPMLRQVIRCPRCHGAEAANEDMTELKKRMGGNPYNAKTFETDAI